MSDEHRKIEQIEMQIEIGRAETVNGTNTHSHCSTPGSSFVVSAVAQSHIAAFEAFLLAFFTFLLELIFGFSNCTEGFRAKSPTIINHQSTLIKTSAPKITTQSAHFSPSTKTSRDVLFSFNNPAKMFNTLVAHNVLIISVR